MRTSNTPDENLDKFTIPANLFATTIEGILRHEREVVEKAPHLDELYWIYHDLSSPPEDVDSRRQYVLLDCTLIPCLRATVKAFALTCERHKELLGRIFDFAASIFHVKYGHYLFLLHPDTANEFQATVEEFLNREDIIDMLYEKSPDSISYSDPVSGKILRVAMQTEDPIAFLRMIDDVFLAQDPFFNREIRRLRYRNYQVKFLEVDNAEKLVDFFREYRDFIEQRKKDLL